MQLKSGVSLLVAQAVDALLPFARSIALARILPPEQLGLVFSLSAAIMILEMILDLGIPISAVRRSESPNLDQTYSTLHAIAVGRAVLVSLMLVLLAPVLSAMLGNTEITWACAFLGLIAFLRGFENLGVKELNRNYIFGPDATLTIAAQIAFTSVSIAIAVVFRDFTSILWGMLAATLTTVLLSHLLSPRSWRLGWHRSPASEALGFGLPLIPTGIASALAQTDRLFIASMLNVSTLALYGILMSFVTLPRTVIAKLSNTVLIPVFSNNKEDLLNRNGHHFLIYSQWVCVLGFLALAYALLLLVIGVPLVPMLFGPNYSPSYAIMGLVATNVFINIFWHLPIPAALAYGHSNLVLGNSVLYATASGAACVSLFLTRSLEAFLVALTCFQFISLCLIIKRTIQLHHVKPSLVWFAAVYPVVLLLILTAVGVFIPETPIKTWMVGSSIAAGTTLCVYLFYFLAQIRSFGIPQEGS